MVFFNRLECAAENFKLILDVAIVVVVRRKVPGCLDTTCTRQLIRQWLISRDEASDLVS